MTRAEADVLLGEYDDAVASYRIAVRMARPFDEASQRQAIVPWHCMNACRERILDALSGEESTQPLAGNAR